MGVCREALGSSSSSRSRTLSALSMRTRRTPFLCSTGNCTWSTRKGRGMHRDLQSLPTRSWCSSSKENRRTRCGRCLATMRTTFWRCGLVSCIFSYPYGMDVECVFCVDKREANQPSRKAFIQFRNVDMATEALDAFKNQNENTEITYARQRQPPANTYTLTSRLSQQRGQ